MMARVAPQLPHASPSPRGVTDLALFRRGSNLIQVSDAMASDPLADSQIGGATRAENDLDGPAADVAQSGPGGRGGALDGPVDGALAYTGGPVNMAPNGKPRIFDASEGTALDPLRDKSWDLNSAKTVDPSALKGPAQQMQGR